MANGLETILSALEGRGGGFFDSPQTVLEATQLAQTAQRGQQQREQIGLLERILEAQTTQQIRGKQETEPDARITQLLREGQIGPVRGTVNGRPVELPASGDLLQQLNALIGLQTAKKTTATTPPDRLNAALGQMGDIRKALDPLVTEFTTLRPNDPRRKEILGQANLLFRNAQALAQGIDALAPGFGRVFILDPLRESFATLGMVQQPPRAGAPDAPPASPKPEKRQARKSEEQELTEGIARFIADLLGIGGTREFTPGP